MLAGVGSFFLLNPLHGAVTGQFRQWGLPAFFAPAVGLYELGIAYLHLYDAENKWLAPKLLAALMGGAVYSHAVAEGKPEASVGALLFLVLSGLVVFHELLRCEAFFNFLCWTAARRSPCNFHAHLDHNCSSCCADRNPGQQRRNWDGRSDSYRYVHYPVCEIIVLSRNRKWKEPQHHFSATLAGRASTSLAARMRGKQRGSLCEWLKPQRGSAGGLRLRCGLRHRVVGPRHPQGEEDLTPPTARGALVLAGSPGKRRRPTPPHSPGRTVRRPRQPPLVLNRMKRSAGRYCNNRPPAGVASRSGSVITGGCGAVPSFGADADTARAVRCGAARGA